MKSLKPIMLLEDDIIDVMTVKRAVKDINLTNEVLVAVNGEEGLQLLEEGKRPCLILLDINMPKMNGIEFLRAIKTDERFNHIPVVVMTTSREDEDKIQSFRLGVAGYMIKPMSYIKFVELMKAINFYWTLSEMPPE